MSSLLQKLKMSLDNFLRDTETRVFLIGSIVMLTFMLYGIYHIDTYYEGGCLKSLPQEELKQCQLRVEEYRKNPPRGFSFPR